MKNQKFILKLADKMRKYPNIKFVLVGDGPDFSKIQAMAANYSNVVLLGRCSDIPVLMKLFDCVILPSLPGEGFPVTMIEAQAGGCRCIISENVTTEVEVGLNLVKSIPLNDVSMWVKELKRVKKNRDYAKRDECAKQLIHMGFGKKEFADKWLAVYNE